MSSSPQERAAFLAARFRLDPEATRAAFQDRDRRLREAIEAGSELVLWFEHDLYDQLQLLQLLDLVAREAVPPTRVRLAQASTYLTDLGPEALAELGAKAAPVTPSQLALAREAWAAFRSPTPEALAGLGQADMGVLPWLGPAIGRLLEELPTDYPGLSASERYILEELEPGPVPAAELYASCQRRERARFMGDLSFFAILDELAAEPLALVAGLPGPFFDDREAYLAPRSASPTTASWCAKAASTAPSPSPSTAGSAARTSPTTMSGAGSRRRRPCGTGDDERRGAKAPISVRLPRCGSAADDAREGGW